MPDCFVLICHARLLVLYKGMPAPRHVNCQARREALECGHFCFLGIVEAIVCGTLVALIMAALHIVELLPGWQRWPLFPSMRFSVWCLSCGCLVALLAMVLWQPRRAVFLDRICISEDNMRLKTLAICSNPAAKAL